MKNPKREPIKVSDPNDKRLRAYNDSNDLYKSNVKPPADYVKKPFVNKVSAVESKGNVTTGYSGKAIEGKIKPIAQHESKSLGKYKEQVKKWADSGAKGKPPVLEGDKKYSVNGSKEKQGGSPIYFEYKKPVQPYVLDKSKPVAKMVLKPIAKTVAKPAPKPIAKPVEKPTAKPTPVVKEDKKMYQGRAFMDSTGLRPGNYTPTQIKEAVAKKKLK
jgi:hypothetical protein